MAQAASVGSTPALLSSRTMTTGHVACRAHCWLTEPRSARTNPPGPGFQPPEPQPPPPRPAAPPSDYPARNAPAPPRTARPRPRFTALRRTGNARPPRRDRRPPPEPTSRASPEAPTHYTASTTPPMRPACLIAHRRADCDDGEPSTPTTTRPADALLSMACRLSRCAPVVHAARPQRSPPREDRPRHPPRRPAGWRAQSNTPEVAHALGRTSPGMGRPGQTLRPVPAALPSPRRAGPGMP